MALEFMNPGLLVGTAAAAIPLIVHLFNRKRAKSLEFGAIDFVLRSRRETARRLRLRRILLFAARTLLLLAIPVALARPHFQESRVAAQAEGPRATALVLDTSLSMSYVLGGKTLLERAKAKAKSALQDLEADEPATFVSCEADAPAPQAPGFDRETLREAIDNAKPTFAAQDLTACLTRASRALGESPLPGKRLLVASDLTAAAFKLDQPPPTVTTPQGDVRPEVVLLDAADGEKELPNVALAGLRVEPASDRGARAFQFIATVANHGGRPLSEAPLGLRIGGEVVAKGFVDVPARGGVPKTLVYRFPSGGPVTGALELTPDALSADDTRPFALDVPREVRALVVNGAPHAVQLYDESFFVETALTSAGTVVRPKLVDAEGVARENLDDFDVVLLLNVRSLPPEIVHALGAWVKKGGGLFFSLGDQIDADQYNETFGALLPRTLHLVKTAAERGKDSEARAARFAQVRFDHPALQVFSGEAKEGLLSAKTYRYFLLSPASQAPEAGGPTTLAEYDDGAPALVEARRGDGRTLLYTSTVDRDWSDWPIRTSFLPVMQRLAAYLAGALEERTLEEAKLGEPKRLVPTEGASDLAVKTPGGETLPAQPEGEGTFRFDKTQVPGIYQVFGKLRGAKTALPKLNFAVQLDPAESDLTRLEERELKAYFGEKTRTEQGAGRVGAAVAEGGLAGLPLWTWLLTLGAILFFAEGALARK